MTGKVTPPNLLDPIPMRFLIYSSSCLDEFSVILTTAIGCILYELVCVCATA